MIALVKHYNPIFSLSLSCFFFSFFLSCSLLCASPCRPASCGCSCSCHFKRPAWCVRTLQYQKQSGWCQIFHPESRLSCLPPVSPGAGYPAGVLSRAKAEDSGQRCCSDAAAPCILRPNVSTSLLHAASRCRMRLQEQQSTGRVYFKGYSISAANFFTSH